MTRIIKGKFDIEMAKHYVSLIHKVHDKEINIESHAGGEGIILLTGKYAIKHPYFLDNTSYDYRKETKNLLKEFYIGSSLEKIGLNVPHMHAVCLDDKFPFLMMKGLNLIKIDNLNNKQRKIAEKQFIEQTENARAQGFIPHDSLLDKNYGIFNYEFDVKNNKGYFMDFSTWRKK